MASSMMGVGNSVGMIVAALVGGLIGAVVLVLAYFVGIALVGAGLGALIAHEVWVLDQARRSSGPDRHWRGAGGRERWRWSCSVT